MGSSPCALDSAVMPLVLGPRILDAGCGFGRWGALLTTNYWETHRAEPGIRPSIKGCDGYLPNVELARQSGFYAEVIHTSFPPLPFPDNSFDAVSCRLGFMFFPDMLLAAKEMVRVLKPGGRIAATVWSEPGKNFWATAVMGVINKKMQLTPPPPEAPGLFRCAKSGLIPELFMKAGLKNISETEVMGKLNIENRKVYWNFMTEVVAPVVAALKNADCELKVDIRREVFQAIKQKYPTGELAIDSNAFVVFGEK